MSNTISPSDGWVISSQLHFAAVGSWWTMKCTQSAGLANEE